jgi:hypothetical protein
MSIFVHLVLRYCLHYFSLFMLHSSGYVFKGVGCFKFHSWHMSPFLFLKITGIGKAPIDNSPLPARSTGPGTTSMPNVIPQSEVNVTVDGFTGMNH